MIPTEERERIELERIRAKKFRALPLNRRVSQTRLYIYQFIEKPLLKIIESAGELGVPCIPKRPLTEPEVNTAQ